MNPNNSRLAAAYIQLIPLLYRNFNMPAGRKTAMELTHLQYHILEKLYNHREGYSMTQLAKNIHISKQQLTPLIAKLEDKDFVVKLADKQDKRQVGLGLTKKGEQAVQNRWESFHQELCHQLDQLSEEDRSDLDYCLNKMKQILSRME